jgi:hypothetical protein
MKKLSFVIILLAFLSCKKTEEAEVDNQIPASERISEANSNEENAADSYIFPPLKVEPINESRTNPSLKVFLEQLSEIIANKDVEQLLEVVDNSIAYSLGEEEGKASFAAYWELQSADSDESALWDILANIIKKGGKINDRGVYIAPYTFAAFPDAAVYDPFTFYVVEGKKVNVRSEPNLKSKVVFQLNYDVVKELTYDKPEIDRSMTLNGNTDDWQKIQTADGKEGYVWGHFLASPLDFRAGFGKIRDEGWKMIFLVAGD